MSTPMKIERAILSVSDKRSIAQFAEELHALGIEILSTGGTAKALREAGVPATEVSTYTGFPEMMGGRLKTLHPRIAGGILGTPLDAEVMVQNALWPIGLVVVNLYPFQETVATPGVSLDAAIEQIDIGGPTMLRAAAKNWKYVAAVTDPVDYERVLEALRVHDRVLPDEFRFALAQKVFRMTAAYDSAISTYLDLQ